MNIPITTKENNFLVPESAVHRSDALFRLVVGAIIFSAIDFKELSADYPVPAALLAGLMGLTYILVTYLIGCSRSENLPASRIAQAAGYLDAAILGIFALLLPLPAATIFAVLVVMSIRAVAFGGFTTVLGHCAVFAFGAVIALSMGQPALEIHTRETLSLVGAFAAPAFMIYLGWSLYHRQNTLERALKAADLEVKQLRVNNYKLAKYLSPSLRKAIFSGKKVSLETQRKKLTVFFSDIKGFSELSEDLETESLTEMLNLYLTEMSEIALKFGGTIDKFIGDAIMVFFGDPTSRGVKEDAVTCVAMALAMQKRMKDLNQRWSAQGINHALTVRMGINTGFCTVGNFGTLNRMDYTLLGTEVNKASRLESACQAGEILISRETYELVKDVIYCESRGVTRLKGFSEPVEIYTAVDLRKNLGKDNLCIDKVTDGFSLYLDIENIPHLQKQPVLATLEQAYEHIRKDINRVTKEDIKIIK